MKNRHLTILLISLLAISDCALAKAQNKTHDFNTPPTFLAISDIHLDHKASEITYGQDTGVPLWARAKSQITQLISNPLTAPKFIMLVGDLPAHGITDINERKIDEQTILQDLRTTVKTSMPIFYVPGNNDGLGGDYHSFNYSDGTNLYSLDPSVGWPALNTLPTCASSTTKACLLDTSNINNGYYSAYPMGPNAHWRLIVLNTVIFNAKKYLADDGISQQQAASNELDWFKNELAKATQNQDHVLLALHIPPGLDGFSGNPMWSTTLQYNGSNVLDAFINLINANNAVITGIISSHTHMDELRKVYNSAGTYIAADILVPAISPQHNNNPAMKMFIFDPSSGYLMNSTTYYSLPAQTTWGSNSYNFSDDYSCAAGITMNTCIGQLAANDLAADLHKEYTVHNSSYQPTWPNIDLAINVNY